MHRSVLSIAVVLMSIVITCQSFAKIRGVTMKKLKTGQELIVSEDRSLPVCLVYAVVQSGYVWDTPKYEGLTGLMGEMLLRGTKSRTREQIQDELDQIGADIDVSVGAESMMIIGQTLKRNLPKFLDIFSDVILNPRFDAKELAKEKRETIAAIKQMRENDRSLVDRFFKRALYKNHPYGMDSDGKESTVRRITLGKIKAQYKRLFVKGSVFFAASGDLSTKDLEKRLSKKFKSFPRGKVKVFQYPKLEDQKGVHILLVDKPARTQTQIMVGHLGIDAYHPDFFPLMIANNAFGGGFTSRLNHEIRVKRGWSYGAYSWFSPRKQRGPFAMFTFPAVKDTVSSLKLVLEMYEKYAKEGLTKEEFNRSQKNLINEFAFKIDTAKKRVAQIVMMKLLKLPDDYLDTYQAKMRKVTLKQVNEAIAKVSDPKNLLITIVCTAKDIKKALKGIRKNVIITTKSYKAD